MAEDPEVLKKRAVAMRYQVEQDTAPRVIAKGRGIIAAKIVEIAEENGIAIYEDPDLVQVLSKIELNEFIPEELYRAVVEILVYVYTVNKRLDEISGIMGTEQK